MKDNPLGLEFTEELDSLYWAYNCPLQMWARHEDSGDENSPVIGWRVLNYMPRKETCRDLGENLVPNEMPTYCKNAATVLRNLASLFDAMADGKIEGIYYPDEVIPEDT